MHAVPWDSSPDDTTVGSIADVNGDETDCNDVEEEIKGHFQGWTNDKTTSDNGFTQPSRENFDYRGLVTQEHSMLKRVQKKALEVSNSKFLLEP